mmetsp:Transcript_15679/g.37390  ORF Transcript_15679/g.37390 Transcript_15679/m.37390 type:complete len:564 (+) Transcript_15679:3-1694(+)
MLRGRPSSLAATLRTTAVISRNFYLPADEEAHIEKQVQQMKKWWAKPRFKDVRRLYEAEELVGLRGTTTQNFPGKEPAKKLWDVLQDCAKNKTFAATFGALDPVQVVQMAKYLKVIYVSGWQSSSTASSSNEPGPDLADYPMDTVPNKVHQLFMAQTFHDRKQWEERMMMSKEERAATKDERIDFLRPIIADGDTGHGGLTAVMKLTKMFIERGVAGIHFEDQRGGAKKCGHMGGKVLVSTQEHVDRLSAARLQCDVLGTETVLVARTDAEAASLIDNNSDPRDQPYILGTTRRDLPHLTEELHKWRDSGKTPDEIMELTQQWMNEANIKTYYESVIDRLKENGAPESAFEKWTEARLLPLEEARELAKELDADIFWCWNRPRTREGFYHYQGGVEQCARRALAFAPYADLCWMETAKPIYEDAKQFADMVHAKYPGKMLAYNLSPSFNWDAADMTDTEIKDFQKRIGEIGFVWQFITLAGFHANSLATDVFARRFASDSGMLAYVSLIQRREREFGVETLTHQKWSGVGLVDRALNAATGGESRHITAQASGDTMSQFNAKK